MWNKGTTLPNEQQYCQMVSFKTSVLARLSIKLAAIFAGAPATDTAKLAVFAENLGIAFQIQDDLINLTSEKYAEGRSYLGEDITEGKKSLLVIKATELLPDQAPRLRQIVQERTSEQTKVEEAIDIVRRSGALDYCREISRQFAQDGWAEAESVLPVCEARDHLKSLSDYLINRDI